MTAIAENEVEVGAARGERGFAAWAAAIHSICGNYQPEHHDRRNFSGGALLRHVGGFDTLHTAMNVDRVRRNSADIRRDDKDYFFLVAQLSGRAVMEQGGESAE